VELSKRPLLRRLLAGLLEARAGDGRALDLDALVRAGWPSEAPHPQVHGNRVWVALSALRRLGLRDVLRKTAEGYELDPAVDVRIGRALSDDRV
jgi:hypothetical protein